jgi:hypothetical protein
MHKDVSCKKYVCMIFFSKKFVVCCRLKVRAASSLGLVTSSSIHHDNIFLLVGMNFSIQLIKVIFSQLVRVSFSIVCWSELFDKLSK